MHHMTPEHRYAVVVCPRCRHAKGIEQATRTTTCGRCSGRHETKGLRRFYETDDPEALRVAVGHVEAKVVGGDAALLDVQTLAAEIDAKTGAHRTRTPPPAHAGSQAVIQYAASAAVGIQSIQKRCDAIFDALDEQLDQGFTQAQAEAAFSDAGIPVERAEKEIRRAIVQDELYEPRPGRLKRL